MVPVKNYLAGFLKMELRGSTSLVNPVGCMLIRLLDVRKTATKPQAPEGFQLIEVGIPDSYYSRHKLTIFTHEGAMDLNEWLDRYFNRLMLEWVSSRLHLKQNEDVMDLLIKNEKKTLIQINASIRDFLQKYSISDHDMPFETALKRYQRLIKHHEVLV